MNNLKPLIALTCTACLLAACGGESAPDQTLPEGATPNDPPADRTVEVEPGASAETETEAPATVPQPEYAPPPPAPQPEPEPEASATPPPLPLPVPEADGERRKAPGLTYILPDGWTVGPAKQMRLLTLLPPNPQGADLAISRWPGDVGGFASNVQRWVRQAGLPPVPNLTTAADSDYETITVGDTAATYIPLMNEDTDRAILAVWVPRGEDPNNPTETWTFKLTCQASQVQALAPSLRAFCESVEFE